MKTVKLFVRAAILVSCACVPLAGFAQQQPSPPAEPVVQPLQPEEKLTLKRAISLAVQNSDELKLAKADLTVAERTTGVQRAVFQPNLFTGSGAAYTHGMPQTPGGAAPSVFNMSYVQTIFNAPLRGQYRAAQEEAEVKRLEADRVRDTIIHRAASDYLELAKVRHAIELLRRERLSAMKISDITRDRAAEGLELEIENTRAALTLARIEQKLAQMGARENVLQHELRMMMGGAPGARFEVAAEDLPALPEASSSELVSLAVANSIDLKQAEHERRAREHRVKGEHGGYFPSIDLIGQYSILSKINNYDQFFNRFERHNVNVGLQVRIPIFAAGRAAAVNLARSELAMAVADGRQRRNDLENDVQRQAGHSRELDAAREVARLELKLAQQNLRDVQAQFDEGRSGLRELEKARLEEHDKWMAFLDADFERQQAQLELMKTTGQIARVLQ